MHAVEFITELGQEPLVAIPREIAEQLPKTGQARVIILTTDDPEDKQWQQAAYEQFMRDDSPEDAEYNPNMKITDAKPIARFQVFLRFDDGVSGIVDLSRFAGRGVFRAWEQEGVFEQLSISPAGALQWPGDLDLCPDALYLQMVGKSAAEVFPALQHSLADA